MLQRHFSTVRIRTTRSIIIGGSSFHHGTAARSYGNSRGGIAAESAFSCLSRHAGIHGHAAFGSAAGPAGPAGRGDWSLGRSSSSSLSAAKNNQQQRIANCYTKQPTSSFRSFHATPRQEILPLIGVATIVLVGRYSFKALQRMEADWEDYYWQLERYERLQQQQEQTENSSSSSLLQHANNIAIDLGSVYTKLATFSSIPPPPGQHNNSSSSVAGVGGGNTRRIPEILISPQGDRSFFNGILYTEQYPPTKNAPAMRGKAALDKFYYDKQSDDGSANTTVETEKVTLPWKDLERAAHHNMDVSNVVAHVLSPALKESLERLDNYEDVYKKGILGNSVNKNNDSDDSHNSHHVRAVVTLPVQYLHHHHESYRTAFDKIWKDFHSNNNDHENSDSSTHHAPPLATIFLPDAVAAIWGAQALGILPDDYLNELAEKQQAAKDKDSDEKTQHSHGRRPQKRIMVVDVGGFTSQFSIVDEYHIVRASVTIPWGGETILERMVNCLLDSEKVQGKSSRTIADNDTRALAALQFHARQALPAFALRSKSQVNIHVPYIFATPGNHHLDTVLSRSVLEQVIQNDVRQRLVAELVKNDDKDNNNNTTRRLSPHMPVPNDMSSLFTSILTQLLESAHETPQSIHHILLVGGASQFPLVQSSLESSVSLLWGGVFAAQQQQQQQLLVVPTTSVHATELVVLGAATMLPSFTYNVNRGLERASW